MKAALALAPAPQRLAYGEVNATAIQGRRVVKGYLGPDPEARRTREVNALAFLAGKIPVPRVIEHDRTRLVTRLAEGVPGLELLRRLPDEVLLEVGRAARALHRLDLGRAYGTQHNRSVMVHGDFGPQNMLFDEHRLQATAILDWEHARVGDPVDDLAWAEWIVRTHHPEAVRSLRVMFDAYGRRPGWPQRHASMVATCTARLDFQRNWADGGQAAVALWQRRVEATVAFRESP